MVITDTECAMMSCNSLAMHCRCPISAPRARNPASAVGALTLDSLPQTGCHQRTVPPGWRSRVIPQDEKTHAAEMTRKGPADGRSQAIPGFWTRRHRDAQHHRGYEEPSMPINSAQEPTLSRSSSSTSLAGRIGQ